MEGVLLPAFIYLCAALVAVPLAHRAGLGSVLGYLAAGVLIGPVLGLAGAETSSLQGIAELGVVMMLFLVGLELEPRLLWRMRGQLIGLGGLQVTLTALALAGIGRVLGLGWSTALVAGMILAMSSTAIALQTLKEKGLLRTGGGQAGFAVLLFQDIAVIPILALIPLLGRPGAGAAPEAEGAASLVAGLPGWAAALATLAAIAVVVLGGHYLSRPLFRFIARARLREVFTAAALAVVIGNALLMTAVGLSPALGAFLAGVVLANSEFRHELESDIEPFKGLLLGLFFVTVGAGIDFGTLLAAPFRIAGLTLGLIAAKAVVLAGLGWSFGLRGTDRWLLALGLAQAGEFGFVLISFSQAAGAIGGGLGATLSLAVALSMLATPLLFLLYDRVIVPRRALAVSREADEITERGAVIIAGLGRFGQVVNRILLSNGYKTVVLDNQAEHVDDMRRFGVRGFYGDASRPDLLHAAGLAEARVLVVAIDDPERTLEMVKFARQARPDIHIVARAFDRVVGLCAVSGRGQRHHPRGLRQLGPGRALRAGGARPASVPRPEAGRSAREVRPRDHADAGRGLGPRDQRLRERRICPPRNDAQRRARTGDDGRPRRRRGIDRTGLDPAAATGSRPQRLRSDQRRPRRTTAKSWARLTPAAPMRLKLERRRNFSAFRSRNRALALSNDRLVCMAGSCESGWGAPEAGRDASQARRRDVSSVGAGSSVQLGRLKQTGPAAGTLLKPRATNRTIIRSQANLATCRGRTVDGLSASQSRRAAFSRPRRGPHGDRAARLGEHRGTVAEPRRLPRGPVPGVQSGPARVWRLAGRGRRAGR